ncbi:MAG: pyridoxamine 5'-phosphate oxidase [Gemmatimonadales bacterium]|nr:pyridoxamine 5'-phosphate oxidase [Gemmatimonadales bacterium]
MANGEIPLKSARRLDRVVSDEAWIKTMLHSAGTGVLATVRDGQPFVNTNLFVYDESAGAIYLHTARVGETRENVEREERVAFTVFELGRLLPADTALEFSAEYASVVALGRAAIVTGRDEAGRALQALLDKYCPDLVSGTDYETFTDQDLDRTSVYRITIEEWSGKRKVAPDEFDGARPYAQPTMLASE